MNPQNKKGERISSGKNDNKSCTLLYHSGHLKNKQGEKKDIPQRNDNQPEERLLINTTTTRR